MYKFIVIVFCIFLGFSYCVRAQSPITNIVHGPCGKSTHGGIVRIFLGEQLLAEDEIYHDGAPICAGTAYAEHYANSFFAQGWVGASTLYDKNWPSGGALSFTRIKTNWCYRFGTSAWATASTEFSVTENILARIRLTAGASEITEGQGANPQAQGRASFYRLDPRLEIANLNVIYPLNEGAKQIIDMNLCRGRYRFEAQGEAAFEEAPGPNICFAVDHQLLGTGTYDLEILGPAEKGACE